MEHYTIEQRLLLVDEYFKNNVSSAAAAQRFQTKYDMENS